MAAIKETLVSMPANSIQLEGSLIVPDSATALIIFVHGSGSSRHSPRNKYVAKVLQQAGFATLLFDLLTAEEDRIYENRFDIPHLSDRLMQVTQWILSQPATKHLKIGYFGASTGAAAAIMAAAELGEKIGAIVSRGGRPDLATHHALKTMQSPTLLIVGGDDVEVLEMNQAASQFMQTIHRVEIIPHATHLFEEPGTLESAAKAAINWFLKYLVYAPGITIQQHDRHTK